MKLQDNVTKYVRTSLTITGYILLPVALFHITWSPILVELYCWSLSWVVSVLWFHITCMQPQMRCPPHQMSKLRQLVLCRSPDKKTWWKEWKSGNKCWNLELLEHAEIVYFNGETVQFGGKNRWRKFNQQSGLSNIRNQESVPCGHLDFVLHAFGTICGI